MNKIIITAAITGSVHIPTMSDSLPITPDEIVEDAVKAWEAGAAIAHIHVRNPENGLPVSDPEPDEQAFAHIARQHQDER